MRLARAMKRKMEKQAATGDLRAAKTYLKAKTAVRHATTREIVEQVAIRKQAVAEITTTMVVAVHRSFGWGSDRILRLRKKNAQSGGVHPQKVREGRRHRGNHRAGNEVAFQHREEWRYAAPADGVQGDALHVGHLRPGASR